MSIRSLATAVALLFCACARSTAPPPQSPGAPRVQAALAMVTVENRTQYPLTVEFRPAGRDRGRVTIGSVPPAESRRLVPIPASEPIVLTARTADGGTLELAPRVFGVDEQWLWLIPRETFFR